MIKLKWMVMLGSASLVIGFAWLGIWSYYVQGGEPIGSIAYELHPPVVSRLMVLIGALILIVTGIAAFVQKLRRKPSVD